MYLVEHNNTKTPFACDACRDGEEATCDCLFSARAAAKEAGNGAFVSRNGIPLTQPTRKLVQEADAKTDAPRGIVRPPRKRSPLSEYYQRGSRASARAKRGVPRRRAA